MLKVFVLLDFIQVTQLGDRLKLWLSCADTLLVQQVVAAQRLPDSLGHALLNERLVLVVVLLVALVTVIKCRVVLVGAFIGDERFGLRYSGLFYITNDVSIYIGHLQFISRERLFFICFTELEWPLLATWFFLVDCVP